jgi:hypothetical protein
VFWPGSEDQEMNQYISHIDQVLTYSIALRLRGSEKLNRLCQQRIQGMSRVTRSEGTVLHEMADRPPQRAAKNVLIKRDGKGEREGDYCSRSTIAGNVARIIQGRLLHQFIDSPANVEPSQVAVVLAHAQEYDGNTSGVDHADERANHVAHGVAFGDDEAVHSDAVVAELTLFCLSVDC